MLMREVQGCLIALLDGYSFSSTFSILIEGLAFGPPLLIILIILKTESIIIGIHKNIAGLSILKNKNIYAYLKNNTYHLWNFCSQMFFHKISRKSKRFFP